MESPIKQGSAAVSNITFGTSPERGTKRGVSATVINSESLATSPRVDRHIKNSEPGENDGTSSSTTVKEGNKEGGEWKPKCARVFDKRALRLMWGWLFEHLHVSLGCSLSYF